MKGAKGVIISITGGEDMRLMEVDEAASHIKELVDPDANIIWGSAFNNDLDGKIRVSVVATGIDAGAVSQAPPQPAKVFAFPTARTAETAPAATSYVPAETAAEEAAAEEEAAAASVTGTDTEMDSGDMAADELMLDEPAPDEDSDELLLDAGSMLDEPETSFVEEDLANGPETAAPGNRSWITGEDLPEAQPAAPKPAREGGTLFERMSNIARGAAKAQVDEEPPAPSRTRDPLDIPRFLGRQNNQ
jgi:cell division protein FtsZ